MRPGAPQVASKSQTLPWRQSQVCLIHILPGLSALWVTLLVWLGCGLTEAVVVSHFLASPAWWRHLALWIAQEIGRVRAATSLL